MATHLIRIVARVNADVRLDSARGRGILLATVLGSGVAFLDGTVVNVALPTLQVELGATLSDLQWIVDAYLLFLTALLLVGGSLGDRFGRRRVYAVGLVWFALASVACGVASNVLLLILARALQGTGAALLVPVSLALVRASFCPEDKDQAVGAWAGLSGVTTAIGPLLGGWLIEIGSWRYIFFINLPLAALGLWAALRWLPHAKPKGNAPKPDVSGGLLAAVGLGGLVFALIEAPRVGWEGMTAWAALLGVVALFGFLVVERRKTAPMLPLELFRSLQFSGANTATLTVYFALNGATFLVVLQLQRVQGYTPLEAGAALTPLTLLLLVLSPLAGKLGSKIGHRWPMTIGPLIAAVGLALLTRVGSGADYVTHVLPGVAVLGLGLGITVAPLTSSVFDAAPAAQAGVASGVNNAVARLAGLLAVAVLPTVGNVFAEGFVRAMWISAAACAAGALCAFSTIERRG